MHHGCHMQAVCIDTCPCVGLWVPRDLNDFRKLVPSFDLAVWYWHTNLWCLEDAPAPSPQFPVGRSANRIHEFHGEDVYRNNQKLGHLHQHLGSVWKRNVLMMLSQSNGSLTCQLWTVPRRLYRKPRSTLIRSPYKKAYSWGHLSHPWPSETTDPFVVPPQQISPCSHGNSMANFWSWKGWVLKSGEVPMV